MRRNTGRNLQRRPKGRCSMRARTNKTSRTHKFFGVLGAVALVVGLAAPSGAYPRPGKTLQVDLSSDGRQPLADCVATDRACGAHTESSVNANGRYVAFDSYATNLVPEDNKIVADVFRRDLHTGRTSLASATSMGLPAMGVRADSDALSLWNLSRSPSISHDGRLVAFTSDAVNLVSGDTNLSSDIFVRDLENGSTERVSLSSDGEQTVPLFETRFPYISGNGRYVAFESDAPNLVANDTNDDFDIFVHDRKTRRTVRGSVSSDESEAMGFGGSLSYDGRYLVFSSDSSNLVEGDTNGGSDVFVRDLKKTTTARVSVTSDGRQSAGSPLVATSKSNHRLSISANGRFVGFVSNATNLVPNDSYEVFGDPDIFVHDLRTGRTERVSVSSSGGEAIRDILGVPRPAFISDQVQAISNDGRFISFYSDATNLMREEPSPEGVPYHTYIHDRRSGATELASKSSLGQPGVCSSIAPALSSSGRYVSFTSCAESFQNDEDTNTSVMWNVFRHDMGSVLGFGGVGGATNGLPPPVETCPARHICLPSDEVVRAADRAGDVSSPDVVEGADINEASLVYRPRIADLYAVVELEDMPYVSGAPLIRDLGLLYGMAFTANGNRYEIRAQRIPGPDYDNAGGASFGLFREDSVSGLWVRVAPLKGGYGTTGMRVVFSLPLDTIGLEDGGKLKDVEAFSALGSYLTGATHILDSGELSR